MSDPRSQHASSAPGMHASNVARTSVPPAVPQLPRGAQTDGEIQSKLEQLDHSKACLVSSPFFQLLFCIFYFNFHFFIRFHLYFRKERKKKLNQCNKLQK